MVTAVTSRDKLGVTFCPTCPRHGAIQGSCFSSVQCMHLSVSICDHPSVNPTILVCLGTTQHCPFPAVVIVLKSLTLRHSEWPKFYGVLAVLRAIGLTCPYSLLHFVENFGSCNIAYIKFMPKCCCCSNS